MNKQDIIRIAQEVGLPHWYETEGVVNEALLIKFAALVEKAVRKKINDEAKAHLEELRNNFDVERNQTRGQA